MIDKAIERIVELAADGLVPRPLDVGDDRVVAFAGSDGIATWERNPPPRRHEVYSLDDLIAMAADFAPDDGAEPDDSGPDVPEDEPVADPEGDPYTPAVYYRDDAVSLVLDDEGHRRDEVTLPLEFSSPFGSLMKLETSAAWHDQKGFIRLLRIDLAGTHDPRDLLNRVRKVTWTSSSTGEYRKDRESLGRDVVAAAADGSDLPEEIDLHLPVWKTAGESDRTFVVRCSVEVDVDNKRFRLLPLPDRLARVVEHALDGVRARLDAGLPRSVRRYHGKP